MSHVKWWGLVVVAFFVVLAWPPGDDKSLAAKFVNWAVDPRDELPIQTSPLDPGNGDDPVAVLEHDMQEQQYDALYLKDGWTRRRLELKVAGDPFDPALERQVLGAIGVLTVFLSWHWGGRKH